MTIDLLPDSIPESDETILVSLVAGTNYTVGTHSSVAVTIMDANAERLLLDNSDGAPWVTREGTWSASSSSVGYWLSDYLHDGNGGKGSRSVTFTPSIASGGLYDVYVRYPAHANYAADVPVDIVHRDGSTTVTVSQQSDGGVSMMIKS